MECSEVSMVNHFDMLVNMIIILDKIKTKKAEAEKLAKELKTLENEVIKLVIFNLLFNCKFKLIKFSFRISQTMKSL